MSVESIVALGGMFISLALAIGTILSTKWQKKVVDADAADKITKAASELIDHYKNLIEELEKNVEVQNKKIDDLEKSLKQVQELVLELESGIMVLIDQLVDKGVTPKWFPPRKKKEKKNEKS